MLHLSSEAPRIIFNEGHHRSSNCTGLGCNYHRPMSIGLIGVHKFPFLKSHCPATGFSKLLKVHQPSWIVNLHRRLIPQTPNQPIQQCAQHPRPWSCRWRCTKLRRAAGIASPLISRFGPRAGLVGLRQTFVRRCQGGNCPVKGSRMRSSSLTLTS